MARGKALTHKEYVERIADRGITLLKGYVNSRTKILHRCDVCGHKWKPSPKNILNGRGCPKCAVKRQTKTHEEYLNELSQRNIIPLYE